MMRRLLMLTVLLAAGSVRGESIWERRDPYFANFNEDMRARRVGDLLTLVVNEATEFEGQEKKEYNKETAAGLNFKFAGSSAVGSTGTKKFAADLDGQSTSNRKFDGKANSTIDRKFVDRMTVQVMAVMPNGVLAIEGSRQRQIGRELRTLKIRGYVRPADIGPFNTIDSQFVGNFTVIYLGRGPDTNFTNQGWGGRLMNIVWPY